MLISDERKSAFIHIPKCGGSTIRDSIGKIPAVENWNEVRKFDNMGKIDTTHIPAFILSDLFPKVFEKITEYQTFALVRDPHSRFISSLAQYCRMFEGRNFSQLSNKDRHATAIKICEILEASGPFLPHDLIHFQRQIDYTHYEGKPWVKNVFLIHDRERIVEFFLATFGYVLDVNDRSATTMVYRSEAIGQGIAWAKQKIDLAGLLPDFIKPFIRRIAYEKGAEVLQKQLITGDVENFINHFYKDDFFLVRSVSNLRGE